MNIKQEITSAIDEFVAADKEYLQALAVLNQAKAKKAAKADRLACSFPVYSDDLYINHEGVTLFIPCESHENGGQRITIIRLDTPDTIATDIAEMVAESIADE